MSQWCKAMSSIRHVLDLWVIILPNVTLKIMDFASKFHFALNIHSGKAMIYQKLFVLVSVAT